MAVASDEMLADTQSTPPLMHGDRLTLAEFERRYAAMPELKKAELLDGVVYLPSPDGLLMNGDHLTLAEFERRYAAMPDVKKAELIDGVVYMASPVRFEQHAEPHATLITWLVLYRAGTPAVRVGDNATVRLDDNSSPQPDALLRLPSSVGGTSEITADGYIAGPPELAVEIAASSVTYDLHDKKQIFRRNGVQEYLVWQIDDRRVDWWVLEEDSYVALPADAQGIIRSRVFPGLWLNTRALLAEDLASVIATLQQGLASEEHAAFAAQLAHTAA